MKDYTELREWQKQETEKLISSNSLIIFTNTGLGKTSYAISVSSKMQSVLPTKHIQESQLVSSNEE